jgi:hypothetical protein
MSPRLDTPIGRQVWFALIVATALFLVALLLVISRMSTTDPVLQQKTPAASGSAVSGSR